jgi:hypothetical protein
MSNGKALEKTQVSYVLATLGRNMSRPCAGSFSTMTVRLHRLCSRS